MKKIVPFNNILTFSTDVCEITAISLEHNIEITSDIISGEFYINGEYKMTDGQLEKEEFNFELPFDIALGTNYKKESLLVDIDDFRYELIERNKIKVNIDLYIDGEVVEDEKEVITKNTIEPEILEDFFLRTNYKEIEEDIKEELVSETEKEADRCLTEEDTIINNNEYKNNSQENNIMYKEEDNDDNDEPIQIPITENLDLLDEMLEDSKEKKMKEENINNTNINIENINEASNQEINIFNGFNEEERYVTYRVYRFLDTDTIDKILEKYNITKEELSKYNIIEDIKPGDKLIIPANDK